MNFNNYEKKIENIIILLSKKKQIIIRISHYNYVDKGE